MEIDFPYVLSDQDARARLEALGKYLSNKHGINLSWLDDTTAKFSGSYMMIKIAGELKLGGGRARFKGEDPGFLVRARAKAYIQGKLERYLDPKIPLAELATS